MTPMLDVAIIGAGLSGLALAERLHDGRRNIAVFEARERRGGRILTHIAREADLALDLGPTWLWPNRQPRMAALSKRLGLTLFRQWDGGHSLYQIDATRVPSLYIDLETHADSRRIEGGCGRLIDGLSKLLPDDLTHLRHRLLSLTDCQTHIKLLFATAAGERRIQARQVVLAAPPRLLAETVRFQPALPAKFAHILRETPTWMAGHAKALLVYEQAFWRQYGFSGNALLRYPGAALAELYDACPADRRTAALFGFFGLPATTRAYYRDKLEELVARQLTGLFGAAAVNPSRVIIQDWSTETFTATDADRIPPNEHPAYGQAALQLDHWRDKLYFCGSETASREGGYMEGALEAAERVFQALAV
ncbi:FAD-dependent oxidoreductase [Methylomonas sp. SURF-2]|uniref:FAD-dependent oxidoreductase n=1 Tax=Methylomonas subterranea TaxID=2952225 RepID=A0ABT1TE69_9GAMM|nr:FAD-dependent oxidoreductase [Methylomonas sp. SURF-2]MCQ8103752.1 FAD-dependent oxidoreductase [Methylomonas sp. SURF-2]